MTAELFLDTRLFFFVCVSFLFLFLFLFLFCFVFLPHSLANEVAIHWQYTVTSIPNCILHHQGSYMHLLVATCTSSSYTHLQ